MATGGGFPGCHFDGQETVLCFEGVQGITLDSTTPLMIIRELGSFFQLIQDEVSETFASAFKLRIC